MSVQSDRFYDELGLVSDFAQLAEPDRFVPVPDDWVVGVADIVNSTGEIERGRYKAVNMVGAAVVETHLRLASTASLAVGSDGELPAEWRLKNGPTEEKVGPD